MVGSTVETKSSNAQTLSSPCTCRSTTQESNPLNPPCPKCNSQKTWRDGQRQIYSETIQRWLCKNCGFRFSDPGALAAFRSKMAKLKLPNGESKLIKSNRDRLLTSQIGVLETKNLGPEQKMQQVPERRIDIAGKIIDYAWKMQKEGYNKETIRGNCGALRALTARGADLADSESVKEALSKEQKWSQNRRRNVINAYTLLLKFEDKSWIKPKCQVTQKFPFIPTEKELDDLIAASKKKHAAFL